MVKALKYVGVFNLVVSGFLTLMLIGFISGGSPSTNDWGAMFLRIFGILSLILSFILSIPMIIFLIKFKLEPIKFYFYTHLSIVVLSLLMLGLSFI